MVGIPGKSQGCNTCRRRKVRCDLGKPSCQKCISLGRQCEGYGRYPVFVNRGQGGLEKRQRLEEARPPPSAPALQNQDTKMVMAPASESLNEIQLLSSFWELYASNSSQYSRSTEPAWLYHAINISVPSDALKKALLSVAYTRLGRLQNDQAMIIRGQRIYGHTIRLMQNALYDTQIMQQDETLAAARCMVLYESFELTSEDMAAWQNHIFGIARIIEIRGPQHHRDPLPRSILESMRYNVMIVSLMRQEASFFGHPDWLTKPWADSPKDFDQRLYDCGFALSDLMHKGGTISQHSAPQELPLILEQVRDSYHGLTNLNEELMALQRRHQPLNGDAAHEVRLGETTLALTSALLIALDLTLSIFASALIERRGGDFLNSWKDVVMQVAQYTDTARRRQLAKQVLRNLQSCLQTQFGYMRSRVIYPLNVVRWELRNIPEDMAQIRALFEAVALGNHFGIARGVQNAGRAMVPTVVEECDGPR